MAKAIAAFEKTRDFNRFDSKFDFEAVGMTAYNDSEQRGADLFDGDAQCGLCHTTEGINGDGTPALLTDFSYDNLGTRLTHKFLVILMHRNNGSGFAITLN